MELIISISIFIAILLVFWGAFLLLRRRLDPELRTVRKKLAELSTKSKEGRYAEDLDIVKKRRPLSNIPWLNQLFWSIPLLHRIDRLLRQSNVKYPLGVFILISCVLAFTGFLVIWFLTGGYLGSFLIAAFLSMTPIFYISMKKKKRMKKFERQLPEALDLIARSLKAGHAFTGGLQMVTEEFEDPIGTEFSNVIDEINFGVSVKGALSTMTERVDCDELKFFIVALNIQRETGGDLCEILEKISYLIRERFKLQGRVRTLSAEGKLSAIILVAIPFFVGFALSILNPDYIKVLKNDRFGNMLISISLFLMVMGIIAMKKIVSIKV